MFVLHKPHASWLHSFSLINEWLDKSALFRKYSKIENFIGVSTEFWTIWFVTTDTERNCDFVRWVPVNEVVFVTPWRWPLLGNLIIFLSYINILATAIDNSQARWQSTILRWWFNAETFGTNDDTTPFKFPGFCSDFQQFLNNYLLFECLKLVRIFKPKICFFLLITLNLSREVLSMKYNYKLKEIELK